MPLPQHDHAGGAGYNGFVVNPDGVIFTKSLERGKPCQQNALNQNLGIACVAYHKIPSYLVAVETKSGDPRIIAQTETVELIMSRVSTERRDGIDYIYCPGSNNPFLLAVPRDTPDRDYTVWVVPEGADTSGLTNVIEFPTSVTELSIFLRVYLPDQNLEGTPLYLSGGVPLPAIESFDTATGSPAPCLPTRSILGNDSGGDGSDTPNPGANTDGQVRFYRLGGGGLYPNEDSAYLATIFKEIGDSVAIIRFKPPTHTDTSNPAGIIPAQAMVRYWSFNVYSIRITNVTACLADYQAVVAKDGFVYIVLGRRTPEVIEKTEGMNFLPWGPHDEILFVYRNVTPNTQFPYSAAAVPVYSEKETQSADAFIGDYAPIGVYTTETRFLQSDPSQLFECIEVTVS